MSYGAIFLQNNIDKNFNLIITDYPLFASSLGE